MGTMAVNQIRVKLYELSPTFEWVDKGCGTIGLVKPPSTDTDTYTTADASDVNIGTDSNDAVDTSGTTGLSDANVVVDSAVEAGVEGVAASIEIEDSKQSVVNVIVWSEVEEDVKLLETVVYKDTEFKIQQDTLLLFQCTTDGIDKALSFQEAESCEDTLARIHMMQGHTPSLSSSWADMSDAEDRRAIMTLPDCTKETLCDLYEKVLEASHSQPDECARALVHGNYVSQLLAIFNTCESEGNTVLLTVIYQLIEVFFSLSSHDLYEHLLSAEHILDVIGALEYDPQLHVRIQHRKALLLVRPRLPIAFKDENLVKHILTTFRIQYLADTILFKSLIDSIYAMASNFVAFNKGEIAKSIVEEESAWIDTVFKVLRTPHKSLATAGTGAICRQTYGATTTNGHTSHTPAHSIESSGAAGLPTETERDNGMDTGEVAENRVYSLEEKRHLTLTIRDLLAMCSHSHEAAFRLNVRTKLMEAGLVDIIAVCMSSPDDETRLAATDSIHILLIMDGEAFRQLVRTQYETYTKHAAGEEKDALRNSMLLRVIVHRIVHDSDGSVKALCAEILKSLFDSTAMEGSITDKRSFQSILYNDSFELLVSPLEEYTPGPSDMSMEEAECRTNTIQIIIELLTFFVTRHGYELRNRVLREFLIVKAMSYLSSPETLLKLCAVRFLRPIVGMQDGFYNRHLVENKILIRLTQALIANGPWYNMVHSAILDVLDTVVESSTTVLIDSLVVDLFSTIANVEFTDVFGKFITNYANRHPAEHQRLIVQQQSHVSNPPTSPSTDNESLNETPRGMSITTPSVLSVPTQAAAQLDSSTNTNRFTGVTTNTHNDVDIELDLDTEEGGASMDVMATEDTMEVPETSGFVGAVDGNNLDDTGADTQLADMSMGEDSDIWQSAGVNVKEAVDTHMSTDTNTNAHGIPSL